LISSTASCAAFATAWPYAEAAPVVGPMPPILKVSEEPLLLELEPQAAIERTIAEAKAALTNFWNFFITFLLLWFAGIVRTDFLCPAIVYKYNHCFYNNTPQTFLCQYLIDFF
jgi:hypothetical protein